MYLRTLRGLKLLDSTFQQPKPLLLMSYLAVEGPKDRRYLAELFWPGAANHMNSLAKALSQLRQAVPGLIGADDKRVWTTVRSDVGEVLQYLDKGELYQAIDLYQGSFLDDFYLPNWGVELEEWVYGTREFLAARVRKAMLSLAEEEAARGNLRPAAKQAEAAYRLTGAAELEPEELSRVYTLLLAGDSPYSEKVHAEAAGYGIDLNQADEIKAHFEHMEIQRLEAKREDTPLTLASKVDIPIPALPVQADTFIGRGMELVEIAMLLDRTDCRLLTLTGLGGIGKTRLALQVAERRKAHVAVGIYFIPLAPLQAASNLAATLLNTLKLPLRAGETPEDQLIKSLKDREMLLVLDNFEHLLEGVSLLGKLLEQTQKLKLLVTSREPLGLSWEHCFEVSGLRYPDDTSAETFEDFDAIKLFTRSAHQADAHFHLERADYPAVLAICRIVEGMPLGLNLAAGWVPAFSCQQLAELLGEDVGKVVTMLKDVPERHRSLEQVFEHAWRLLSDRERAALSKLAVFRGSFDKEAARVVAGALHITLLQLKLKSLVRRTTEERFDLHEVIRQGAQKKLKEDADTYQTTRTEHSRYYLSWLADLGEALRTGQAEALRAIEGDLNNIREAWFWAVDQLASDLLEPSLTPLNLFFMNQGRFQELLDLYSYAEGHLRKHERTQQPFFAKLLLRKAWSLGRLGDVQKAVACSEESLALARHVADTAGIIGSLNNLGTLARRLGQYEHARSLWQEALELAKDQNDIPRTLPLLSGLASLEEQGGNAEQAEACYRHATQLAQQTGNIPHYLDCLNNLATFLLNVERFDEAVPLLRQGLDLAESLSHRDNIPYFLLKLARVAVVRKSYDEAWSLAQRALVFAQEQHDTPYCAKIFHFLGDMALSIEQPTRSLDYFARGLQLACEVQSPATVHELLFSVARLYHDQAQSERAASLISLLLQQPGLGKTIEKRIRDFLETLHQHLSPVDFTEPRLSTTLKEVIDEVIHEAPLAFNG